MNGEIYSISAEQFERMLGDRPNKENAIFLGRMASDIIVGMFNGLPLCYIGLTPTSLISNSIYVWMIETEAGIEHKLLLARHSKQVLKRTLEKYSIIVGHCFNARSAAWLRWLGAEFTSPTVFEFRRG